MSKFIPGNQKHLSLDDRKYIEKSLNQGLSFKETAKYLCKDPTTISKEVRAHRLSDWYHKGTFYNAHNLDNGLSIPLSSRYLKKPHPAALHMVSVLLVIPSRLRFSIKPSRMLLLHGGR